MADGGWRGSRAANPSLVEKKLGSESRSSPLRKGPCHTRRERTRAGGLVVEYRYSRARGRGRDCGWLARGRLVGSVCLSLGGMDRGDDEWRRLVEGEGQQGCR